MFALSPTTMSMFTNDTISPRRIRTVRTRALSCEASSPLSIQSGETDLAKVSETTLGQAEELVTANMGLTTAEMQQEVVHFQDNERGENLDIKTAVDYTRGDDSQSVDLDKFLIRPVKIYQTTWTEGSVLAKSNQFYPWHLYFNNAQIKKKLDNYYLLKCNLKLKVVINASPFYYGCGSLAYQPLFDLESNWDYSSNPDYFEDALLSQKPIVYFYPQTNSGAEMTLPWVYHKEWVRATSATDLKGLGRCCLSSFTNLYNANAVVGSNVQVTIYAWAEDVKLAGPTQSLSVQSGEDEYDGFISKPASAIARAAGCLEEVPVIGPFATATGTVASVIGSIASLFGFSRVAVNESTKPMRSKTHPNLANTDIHEVIDKLTFDSKNELSIDPKICGVPLSDEMDISSFVMREALMDTVTWAATDTTGTFLKVYRVNPGFRKFTSRTNENLTLFSPMAYVSHMFKYWRGDIIIKLKIICSQYHKGRLEITWDPISPLNAIADSSMINYTHILDISDQTEVEFRIPYTQPTAYQETSRARTTTFIAGSPFTPVGANDNGTLGIRVLNPQTSPVASADIQILTYVRGAGNLEFAGPVDLPNELSPYEIQSGEDDMTEEVNLGIKPSRAFDELNLVYHGECVRSFRTLMQRMTRYTTVQPVGTSTVSFNEVNAYLPRMLLYPGFDPNGIHTANDVKGVGTSPYNYVGWHYSNWLALAFIGNRGSINYTVSPVDVGDDQTIVNISRKPEQTTRSIGFNYVTLANINDAARRALSSNGCQMSGVVVTNTKTQSTITTGIPMYSQYKMMSNNPIIRTNGSNVDGSDEDAIEVFAQTVGNNTRAISYPMVEIMAGVGVDFSLVFFSGLQPLYWYDTFPTA